MVVSKANSVSYFRLFLHFRQNSGQSTSTSSCVWTCILLRGRVSLVLLRAPVRISKGTSINATGAAADFKEIIRIAEILPLTIVKI